MTPHSAKRSASVTKLELQSPSFAAGGVLPQAFTCNGENVSPPLSWMNVPPEAKSMALICDDPDAPDGTWVHWVLYNLPATTKSLPRKVPPRPTLNNGASQGINDFKAVGYSGACPPEGTHRYVFKLYALDIKMPLKTGISKAELLQAMDGHVLAQGQLVAKYTHP